MEYEVMEVTMYRTTDGEIFEKENDALEHQNKLILAQIDPSTIIMKDKWGEFISPEAVFDNANSVFFVELLTDEAVEFFRNVSAEEGLVLPCNIGCWRWSDEYEEWVSPEEDLKKFQENWSFYTHKVKFNFTES